MHGRDAKSYRPTVGFYGKRLLELDDFGLGRLNQFDSGGFQPLSIGWVRDATILHLGVDNDAADLFLGDQL